MIFGAAELGNDALAAYNEFATGELTSELPSILMVDRKQSHIIDQARRGSNRILLPMPLKVKQLRTALTKLLAGTPKRELGTY